MCKGPTIVRARMIIDPLQSLPVLAKSTTIVELKDHYKSASKPDHDIGGFVTSSETKDLKLKLHEDKFKDTPRLEPLKETQILDEKVLDEKSSDTITFKRSKSLLSKRSHKSSQSTNSQVYKAVNVKVIGRNSEAFAQCSNIKEDKRLVQRLSSIDREMNVCRNSITRDEKVLLQRSRALANVLTKRDLHRGQSRKESDRTRKESDRSGRETERSVKEIEKSRETDIGDRTMLYGVKLESCHTSKDDGLERIDGRSDHAKSKDDWANKVSGIMKKDIKTWHNKYITSTRQKSRSTLELPRTALPIQPPLSLTGKSESSTGSFPLKKHFVEKQKSVDKGDWIANYINTSCVDFFPTL